MTEQAWLPQGVDTHRPTDARVYDYALGGKDNYAIDRAYAHKLFDAVPGLGPLAVENGKFARRAIRYLLSIGVRQFLEIGSGMPHPGNVHDVAGAESTTLYVDYCPVAVSHFQAVLSSTSNAEAVHADVTMPEQMLDHPVVTELVDLTQPVAILMTNVLHLVTDEERPDRILAYLRDSVAPGSHLVLSHASDDVITPDEETALYSVAEELREPLALRGQAQVTALFDGFDILDPGVVLAPEWRPDRPYRTPCGFLLAGVGRKA